MKNLALTAILIASLFTAQAAFAHCQIPCGIYDDEARIAMLDEDIVTIEKSIREINRLSAEKTLNHNQIVRWVQNKEDHANRIIATVTDYFMAQRIKPAPKKDAEKHSAYVRSLTLLHQILVHAMKAKQLADLKNVETLKSLVAEFAQVYFVPEPVAHKH